MDTRGGFGKPVEAREADRPPLQSRGSEPRTRMASLIDLELEGKERDRKGRK
jgi:hypothetical protein